MRRTHSLYGVLFTVVCCITAHADNLAELGTDFWQWREIEQPFSTDDIPRIERPEGYTVDWSAKIIAQRLVELAAFEQRWQNLNPAPDTPIANQVDYRLLGSAIARVRWELAITESWRRNPSFYVDQTIGSVFALLLQPAPFTEARQVAIIARLRTIPKTLLDSHANLTDIRRPFATLTVEALERIDQRLAQTVTALAPHFTEPNRRVLQAVVPAVSAALVSYRNWVTSKVPSARPDTAIGLENYLFFLRNVALIPYTPEQLLDMSDQEWSRAVAFESYQRERLLGTPAATIFTNADAQIAGERIEEQKIREYLTSQHILSVPEGVHHYRNLLTPDYLQPLADFGETDDLTSATRLDEDGISYIQAPTPHLGFFRLSTAQDPRPIIVHEGVPGHYFQLCMSWSHPDELRRHYYDSGANEGIGFYAEEMMLQAGLFDDNPRTRETIYSFMRLRALRVAVDVRLALGLYTLQQAADYLESTVPVDKKTALSEAAFFASSPGQAISYQIGKIQITKFLSDTKRAKGERMSLLEFNNYLWSNGNVPISLQRWESLGDPSEVPPLPATKHVAP